jgi:quercetin 2,3-dioxygenase
MISIRKGRDRGHFDHGWLDTYHTFSFDTYYDPAHMGYRSLRVINEDRVKPAKGFPTHGHRDMEIITYVLEGMLEHKDSMGNGSIIRPGDVQRMTAGTGVTHSEYNASRQDSVHLLQIWILPERRGLAPGYEQKNFSRDDLRGKLKLIASREGKDGSVTIHQDALLYGSTLEAGEEAAHTIAPGRGVWLQVARGALSLNGHALTEGDGVAVSDEGELHLKASAACEFLLFDLA